MLNAKFSLKDVGALNFFLGIEVCEFEGGLLLKKTKYIKSLLIKAKLTDAKPAYSMISSLKLSTAGGVPFETPTLHQGLVGALQYVALSQPTINFAINKVCQYMDNHWNAVKRSLNSWLVQ